MKYGLVLKGLAVKLGEDVALSVDEVNVEVEASAEEYMNSIDLVRQVVEQLQEMVS